MKLYYDPLSTTCRAVMTFVGDERLDIDLQAIDLMAQENLSPDYGAINPNQLVPFIVDGSLSLGESSAILKYLAEKTGSRAYPSALIERARVNSAMDWFNTQFAHDFCDSHVYPQVLPAFKFPPVDLGALIDHGARASARWFDVLDRRMLSEQPFVCGEEISLADYLGAAFVTLGELVAFDFSTWPNVRRWIDLMKGRPGWPAAYAGFNGWMTARRSEAA